MHSEHPGSKHCNMMIVVILPLILKVCFLWKNTTVGTGLPRYTWETVIKIEEEDNSEAVFVNVRGVSRLGECFFWYGPTQVVPDKSREP